MDFFGMFNYVMASMIFHVPSRQKHADGLFMHFLKLFIFWNFTTLFDNKERSEVASIDILESTILNEYTQYSS